MTSTAKVFLSEFAALAVVLWTVTAGGAASNDDAARTAFAGLPLYFEANQGQTVSEFQFFSRGRSCNFFIAPTEAVLALNDVNLQTPASFKEDGHVRQVSVETRSIRLRLVEANANAQVKGIGELPGKINYFIGNDPARWRANVPIFTQTRVEEIYQGINLIYYGNQQRLEFDFEVSPSANPAAILMRIDGADRIQVDAAGDLVLTLGKREIRQQKPLAYQVIGGARKEIPCAYHLKDAHDVTFQIGDYDRALPLIIDPILSYSSFFGGSGSDIGRDIALDVAGAIYIAGETLSLQLPTTAGAFQTNFAGAGAIGDVFVAKFDNTLSNLVYLTYLGGSASDGALAIALDGGLNAYITGYTTSSNFPVASPISTNIGGTPISGLFYVDAFVTKLNPSGSGLVYSTYLGGNRSDEGYDIAVDSANQAYVTGFTESTNFPVKNAFQTNLAGGVDAFVVKLTAAGNDFVYSTYLGGTNQDRGVGILADSAGDACVVGFTGSTNFPLKNALQSNLNNTTNNPGTLDAFIGKLTPSGNDFVYSTFVGGSGDDAGLRIALDGGENSFVTGWTTSTNFPVTVTSLAFGIKSNNVSRDVFVAGLNPNGTSWIYSTIFGGAGSDEGRGLAVDLAGNVFVAGSTSSTNFPTAGTSGFLRATNSGSSDVFVAEISPGGSNLIYSIYLGGSQNDLAHGLEIDPAGDAFIVGETASANFPVVAPFQPSSGGSVDAFLVRIEVPPALVVSAAGSDIQLAWRAFAPAYHLESKADAAPAWTPVSQVPILANGWYTVTLAATNEISLFRLRRD